MSPSRHIYLHGFASGPSSQKAAFFRDQFQSHGLDLIVPHLVPGEFVDVTISSKLDVLKNAVSDTRTNSISPDDHNRITLIGSSMGGYVATLYATRHPDQIERLVLLAPAFGFPTRWLESGPPEAVEAWRTTGFHKVYHHERDREEPVGYQLVTDAKQYPDYPVVPKSIPILILHGRDDETVPLSYSEHFIEHNPHARFIPLDSDHTLDNVHDILWDEVAAFLDLTEPAPKVAQASSL